MRGLMMESPLTIAPLLAHAERWHADTTIVARLVDGSVHRTDYAGLGRRARQLAQALRVLGARPGDRVGTLAWNGYRHFEL